MAWLHSRLPRLGEVEFEGLRLCCSAAQLFCRTPALYSWQGTVGLGFKPQLTLASMFPAVDQERHFQDKYLFYRFLDDEHEDAPLPTEEEKKECDEELQDTMLLLSQMGPDAHMRMILRKP